jgi:DNA adenine methylase
MPAMKLATTRRPVIRYYGGKAALAPWIIERMPAHRIYCEPFGGGAAVLLQKPRAPQEIYNDLDDGLVGLFRVLRDPELAARLVELIALTPFARTEFLDSYEPSKDPVESARRLLVRSHMGHGGEAVCGRKTGFRYLSHRKENRGTHPAIDWQRFPEALAAIAQRLAGIVVEHCDAFSLFSRYDGSDTLFYVDPPYPKASRSNPSDRCYNHDFTEAQHIELAEALLSLRATVLVSGYRSEIYDSLYADWWREDKASIVQGGGRRIESLWMNREPSPRLFR